MYSASLDSCSILVCEDEPLIALDVANAFTNAGARVVTVRSLAQAFMVVEDDAPSVVILDHALRTGESSQLCERLKEQNIPYVFHRGYPNSGGASDYELSVSERAAAGLLVTVVEGLLRNRRAH